MIWTMVSFLNAICGCFRNVRSNIGSLSGSVGISLFKQVGFLGTFQNSRATLNTLDPEGELLSGGCLFSVPKCVEPCGDQRYSGRVSTSQSKGAIPLGPCLIILSEKSSSPTTLYQSSSLSQSGTSNVGYLLPILFHNFLYEPKNKFYDSYKTFGHCP